MKELNKETKCFKCKKAEMFMNQAGGMTCPKCGQLVFPIDAKEHLKLLNMLFDSKESMAKYIGLK